MQHSTPAYSSASPDKLLRDKCILSTESIPLRQRHLRIYLSKCSNDPKAHSNKQPSAYRKKAQNQIDPMHIIKLSRGNLLFKQVFNALLQAIILALTISIYESPQVISQSITLFLVFVSQWILFQIHMNIHTISRMLALHHMRFSSKTNNIDINNQTTVANTRNNRKNLNSLNQITFRKQLRMYTKGNCFTFLTSFNYQYLQYLINLFPLLLFTQQPPFTSSFSAWMLLFNILRCVFVFDGIIACQRVDLSHQYALIAKYNLHTNPLKFVSISLTFLIMISAIFLAAIEDSAYLWDSIWNLTVSITTIGYGDIVPVSSPARLLVVLVSNFGVLFLSFITTIIQSSHELNQHDIRQLNKLENLHSITTTPLADQTAQTQSRLHNSITTAHEDFLKIARNTLFNPEALNEMPPTTTTGTTVFPQFSIEQCLAELEYHHESITEIQERLFSGDTIPLLPEFIVNETSFSVSAGMAHAAAAAGGIFTPKRKKTAMYPRSPHSFSSSDPRTMTFQALSSPLIQSSYKATQQVLPDLESGECNYSKSEETTCKPWTQLPQPFVTTNNNNLSSIINNNTDNKDQSTPISPLEAQYKQPPSVPLTLSFQKQSDLNSYNENNYSSVQQIHGFTDAYLVGTSTVGQSIQSKPLRNKVRNFNEVYAGANYHQNNPNITNSYSFVSPLEEQPTHQQFLTSPQQPPSSHQLSREEKTRTHSNQIPIVLQELQENSENLSLSLDAEIPPFFYKNSIFTKNSIDEINFEL